MSTIIPIGPYHPLQEEPEFFKLHVDGERVERLEIEIGYNHRGIEKIAESKTFDQALFLVERICGICSTSHPFAGVNAMEDLAGIVPPERALYARTFIGELERLHSHLLWLGLAGHFIGYNTLWMWAWKTREPVLDIFEKVTGNRQNYAMMKIGGIRRDLDNADIPWILKTLDGIKPALDTFRGALLDDPVLHARLKGVGILTREDIIATGALGPTARASGVDIDVRRDDPYAAYGRVKWKVILGQNGDVFDKAYVRVLEMYESVGIIEQCLKNLPGGEFDLRVKALPPGEGIGRHEAPRGECIHYVLSDGSSRPVRYKIRAPSFMNLPTNYIAVKGATVSDATLILAAVDPCYCCTERMAAVRSKTGEVALSGEELIRLSREKTNKIAQKIGVEMESGLKKSTGLIQWN
ncbi:MAG: nickel-dependent hydrogenase large subunit [Candidatus Aureabacteria bacterium]|nr:nickel-dependent hydrogenase large subunit [Candidatus Auribacterota bacterium]